MRVPDSNLPRRTTRITLAILLVLSHPLWAATIIVDETTCTLVDALNLTNSKVTGNSAPSVGGGIVSTGMLTLTNSTVSGNWSDPYFEAFHVGY